MALFGVTNMAMTEQQNADIRANFFANASDPGKVASLMEQYGVSAADLDAAVAGHNGVTSNDVQDWTARAGLSTGRGAGFGGNTSTQQQMYTDWYADRNRTNQEVQGMFSGGGGAKPAGGATGAISSGPALNLGMGQSGQQGQSNPYIGAYGNAITNQVTQNLQRNVLPQIASSAMAAGGFGGSRQGVVEANALNDANQGLSNALAGAYSQDWNAQQGRNLSQYGMDQNYNLGLGNLGLNAQNSVNNFYTAQRGQDIQSAGLGAQLTQMGNQGYLNQGQGIYNVGNTEQQAPWNVVNNTNNVMSPWAGNTSTTSGSTSSNGAAGFMGGAVGGAQLYNNWSNSQNNPYSYTGQSGFSNTPNYMVVR